MVVTGTYWQYCCRQNKPLDMCRMQCPHPRVATILLHAGGFSVQGFQDSGNSDSNRACAPGAIVGIYEGELGESFAS